MGKLKINYRDITPLCTIESITYKPIFNREVGKLYIPDRPGVLVSKPQIQDKEYRVKLSLIKDYGDTLNKLRIALGPALESVVPIEIDDEKFEGIIVDISEMERNNVVTGMEITIINTGQDKQGHPINIPYIGDDGYWYIYGVKSDYKATLNIDFSKLTPEELSKVESLRGEKGDSITVKGYQYDELGNTEVEMSDGSKFTVQRGAKGEPGGGNGGMGTEVNMSETMKKIVEMSDYAIKEAKKNTADAKAAKVKIIEFLEKSGVTGLNYDDDWDKIIHAINKIKEDYERLLTKEKELNKETNSMEYLPKVSVIGKSRINWTDTGDGFYRLKNESFISRGSNTLQVVNPWNIKRNLASTVLGVRLLGNNIKADEKINKRQAGSIKGVKFSGEDCSFDGLSLFVQQELEEISVGKLRTDGSKTETAYNPLMLAGFGEKFIDSCVDGKRQGEKASGSTSTPFVNCYSLVLRKQEKGQNNGLFIRQAYINDNNYKTNGNYTKISPEVNLTYGVIETKKDILAVGFNNKIMTFKTSQERLGYAEDTINKGQELDLDGDILQIEIDEDSMGLYALTTKYLYLFKFDKNGSGYYTINTSAMFKSNSSLLQFEAIDTINGKNLVVLGNDTNGVYFNVIMVNTKEISKPFYLTELNNYESAKPIIKLPFEPDKETGLYHRIRNFAVNNRGEVLMLKESGTLILYQLSIEKRAPMKIDASDNSPASLDERNGKKDDGGK